MAVGLKDAFGVTGGAGVDTNLKALRVAPLPLSALAQNSIANRVSGVTVIASAGTMFSLQNTSASNVVVIKRLGIGFITTTGFTAAQEVSFGLRVARSFSAADTAGTSLAPATNNGKKRTSSFTPSATAIRICTTAAITAGTRTLDTFQHRVLGGFVLATTAGVTIAPAVDNLWGHSAENYPLVLAQNEGIVIECLVTMGAAGVGTFFVNCDFDEYLTANFNG
jgi:hypothetical protein